MKKKTVVAWGLFDGDRPYFDPRMPIHHSLYYSREEAERNIRNPNLVAAPIQFTLTWPSPEGGE